LLNLKKTRYSKILLQNILKRTQETNVYLPSFAWIILTFRVGFFRVRANYAYT